ncbi:MAG: B12-binding domain-containing radical SAM protein [Chloroflexi bacterium]|nr:B12-binding domain-containing radical SAM protein [Chloroflexota bacterium]
MQATQTTTLAPIVLLYNPISTSPGKQRLPMSLLSIAAVIDHDYTPEIIDGNLIADPAPHIIERAKITGAKILAVTAMPGPQLKQAIQVCKRVKTELPGLVILWGGYFATHHGQVCLESGIVDYVIEGQGEAPFRKFVDTIHHGGSMSDVPSLVWKDNGSVIVNPRAPMVPLDNLPLFPYHRVNIADYRGRSYLGKAVLSHHTSFGCPFACSFCAVVKLVNQHWLPESPARVEQVTRMMVEQHGADAMEFHDMDYFVSESRAAEIAERIEPLGIHWWALGRVDTLSTYSEPSWQKIKRSGCKMIFMGAESGSAETLKIMNKGGQSSPDKTLAIAEKFKHMGIVPEFSFVMGNPPDALADIENTIQFIRKLKKINPASELILYIYTPVPHDRSELLRVAEQLGFHFPQTLEEWASPEWESFAHRREPNTPFYKDTARKRVRNFETVVNAYYPTVTDMRLKGTMRMLLKGLSGIRYKTELYGWPLELKALQRFIHYRRPETMGF